MREILEYALKKLEGELSYTERISSLFSNKDNSTYRKSWYEVVAIRAKEDKGKFISFDDFEKQQLERFKNEIKSYKKMISEIKHELQIKDKEVKK